MGATMKFQKWKVQCDKVGRCVIPKTLRAELLDNCNQFEIVKQSNKFEIKRGSITCVVCGVDCNRDYKIVENVPICDECISKIKKT